MGRIVNQDSLTKAKRKAEYIMYKNRLIGEALQIKLNEEKEDRKKHLRNNLIKFRKEENIND